MTDLTDPASEPAHVAFALSTAGSRSGDSYLKFRFRVASWSMELFRIIACVCERAGLVGIIVERLRLEGGLSQGPSDVQERLRGRLATRVVEHHPAEWADQGSGGTLLAYLQETPRSQIG